MAESEITRVQRLVKLLRRIPDTGEDAEPLLLLLPEEDPAEPLLPEPTPAVRRLLGALAPSSEDPTAIPLAWRSAWSPNGEEPASLSTSPRRSRPRSPRTARACK